MRTPLRQFDKGLWLASPGDAIPQGTMRRNRGIHPLSKDSMRSRSGSMELYTLADVHSIYYFADSWVAGASTIFYYAGAIQYGASTEVDIAADRVTVGPALIAVTDIDTDENVWVYYDFTAAFFDGDFEFRFDFRCTASTDGGICGLWALTNDLDGLYGLANGDKDHLCLYCSVSAADRYGDGSDGDVTISSNTNLTEAKQYDSLTIDAEKTLNTAGYLVKVKETLTNNGTITDSTSGDAGGAGGAAGATKTAQGDGNSGSDGSDGSGVSGNGGGGGGSGACQNYVNGTVNGGAGGTGGTGGKGGGTVLVNAKTFINNGTVHANGGDGVTGSNGTAGQYDVGYCVSPGANCDIASGGGGGGAGGNGGNGGTVTLYYDTKTTGTVTVAGGGGGTRGTGGAGHNTTYTYPGGTEYSGGEGGSLGGGTGGKGEEGSGASDAGANGTAGNTGAVGTTTWTQDNAAIPALTLQETNGSTDTTDASTALVLNTRYYPKIVRDDDAGTHGSLVCTIYSDAKRSVVADTLTVTLTEQQDFRYLFAMISYDGASGGNEWSGEIGGLQIVTPDVGLSSVKTGLSGSRLSIAKMAPVAGITDYLFIAGGEDLFKVTNAGAVSNWGIVAPDANPSAADGGTNGKVMTAGVYQYKITFKNSTTGHRSDPNPTAASVTVAADNSYVALTSIDTTTDTQADKVEIWRTMVDGSIFFYLTEINEGTVAYDDNNADSALSTTELPTDNLEPYTWFDDCIGPHNASMFWITRTQSGNRGRMYYSPIGRAESVQGFIEVTSDDDGLQKLVQESGMLGVFSKSGFFRILGTNPYTVQEISGMPGTTKPHTVVVTPLGIVYEAADGVRLLRGLQSTLINPDAVNRLFRGEDVENLTSFSGLVAAYARGEYFISDGSQTLAVNLRDGTWRDVGYGSDAYFYAEELDILALSNKAKILDFEKEGTSDDDGTDIDVSIEPSLLRHDNEKESIIQHTHIDSDTADETLAVTLITDNSTVSLGNLSTSSRSVTTFNVGKTGQVVGVRLAGSLSEKIEVFGVDVDSYVPGEVRA